MSSYRELVRVTVSHDFYSGGVCNSLEFRPTARTSELFLGAGLVARSLRDGVRIVFDETRLEALHMYAQESASFDFLVYSRDPDFRSYSEPFTALNEKILYFDNLGGGKSKAQVLSLGDQVSSRDLKAVDAPELDALIGPRERRLPPLFALRIFTDGRKSLLAEWLKSKSNVYSIHFGARQRYWKYYLLGKLTRQLKPSQRYHVVDPEDRVEFDGMDEEVLADDRLAFTFRSRQPIPLHEYYPFRLQLVQRERGAETVVIDSLPVASIEQIGLDRSAEQTSTLSEIYINS